MTFSVPWTPVDSAWTSMNVDGLSPPTHPDVVPQPRPKRTSVHSSTKSVTGYPILAFRLIFLLYLFGLAEAERLSWTRRKCIKIIPMLGDWMEQAIGLDKVRLTVILCIDHRLFVLDGKNTHESSVGFK